MEERVKSQYDRILFHYDLTPKQIEQVGHVSKIVSSRGTFALKETSLTNEQWTWFIHVMERLRQEHIPHIPIYPTKYGDLFIHRGEKTYYLMPWVFTKDSSRMEESMELLRQAAILHHTTVKEQEYSEQVVEDSEAGLMGRWRETQQRFEQFAYHCEHKVYQSPFELEYLSHFRELMAKIEEAKMLLGRWKTQNQEAKVLRTVLCHGKLSPTHVLINDHHSVLINFEKAMLDTPVRDLAIFIRRACFYLKLDDDGWYKLLNGYESVFPLRNDEKLLLQSYLTYPEPIIKLLNQYEDPAHEVGELAYVSRFEQALMHMRQIQHINAYLKSNPSQSEAFNPHEEDQAKKDDE